jgi:hypothetical protein
VIKSRIACVPARTPRDQSIGLATLSSSLLHHRGGASPAHRKAPAARAGALICCSVLVGHQQCRDRSVSLSNDPHCLSVAHAIAAQQLEALFETQFVFSLVVLAEIAPNRRADGARGTPVAICLPVLTARALRALRRSDQRETAE